MYRISRGTCESRDAGLLSEQCKENGGRRLWRRKGQDSEQVGESILDR